MAGEVARLASSLLLPRADLQPRGEHRCVHPFTQRCVSPGGVCKLGRHRRGAGD